MSGKEYQKLAARTINQRLSAIEQMNIDKLKERYPEGFSVEKSLNRKEGDI